MIRHAIALLAFSLCSCAAKDDIVRDRFNTLSLSDNDSGYVIASEASGNWLFFLNVGTRQEFKALGTYCTRLPVGHYTLYKIGTPYGTVTSENPFAFDVSPGQINYVGTVAAQWVSDARRYAADRAKNPPVRKYDLHDLFGTSYEYTLFDRLNDLGDRYKKSCPGIDSSKITTSLMK